MVAIIALAVTAITVIMAGALPGLPAVTIAGLLAVIGVVVSQIWAVATWAADRWIARARVAE